MMPAAGEAELRRVAHQLRGTGATYGFPAITQFAGEAEDAPWEELPKAGRRLADLLQGITASDGERVLLVEDDPTIVLVLEAARRTAVEDFGATP